MTYVCPTCGIRDTTAWQRCNHPNCPDGRDQARNRPLFCDTCDCEKPCPRAQRRSAGVPPWLWIANPLGGLLLFLGFLALLKAI